jgi:predicted PolB exonuclease-like 3'-5' exonuclease
LGRLRENRRATGGVVEARRGARLGFTMTPTLLQIPFRGSQLSSGCTRRNRLTLSSNLGCGYTRAMNRGFLVLDIETVPDRALWNPPEVAGGTERPFPPLYAHRPIVLGVLWLDESYGFRRLGVIGEAKDEAGALSDFAAFVERERPHLVTYNGRGFDLPVIMLRCLRHGVTMRFYYQDKDYRYRYSDVGHIDLCDFFAEHGAARVASLDAMARLIGLPGKVGVDGSQVEGLYNAGQLEAIKNYCLSDVAQTAFLLLRFRLLQGALSPERYRSTASALLEALAADGRLEGLVTRIDRERLLIPAAA